MQVSVKYFASLRELIGETTSIIHVEEGATVDSLWRLIIKTKNVELDNVMMAVNMEYVKSEHQLKSGDEVAFFPPVTGG
jgi:sulfur-carrier protein|tara:strand:- start:195 stop:431 length:237 start_codon:yes stop_codon:yes gene_type:complete